MLRKVVLKNSCFFYTKADLINEINLFIKCRMNFLLCGQSSLLGPEKCVALRCAWRWWHVGMVNPILTQWPACLPFLVKSYCFILIKYSQLFFRFVLFVLNIFSHFNIDGLLVENRAKQFYLITAKVRCKWLLCGEGEDLIHPWIL